MAGVKQRAHDDLFVDAMRRLVDEAVRSENDQRGFLRVPYFREVFVEDADGEVDLGQAFCRDITPQGLGLVHSQPLGDVELCIRVQARDGELAFRGRQVWSRPAGDGWYLSGVVLTGANESPATLS